MFIQRKKNEGGKMERWRDGEEGEVLKQLREISSKLDTTLTNTVFFISKNWSHQQNLSKIGRNVSCSVFRALY